MAYEPGGSDRREELVAVIRRVRNRWRLKLALRGAVIVVAGTLLALLLSASSLEALRFSPAAIITFRILALVVFAALVMVGGTGAPGEGGTGVDETPRPGYGPRPPWS